MSMNKQEFLDDAKNDIKEYRTKGKMKYAQIKIDMYLNQDGCIDCNVITNVGHLISLNIAQDNVNEKQKCLENVEEAFNIAFNNFNEYLEEICNDKEMKEIVNMLN